LSSAFVRRTLAGRCGVDAGDGGTIACLTDGVAVAVVAVAVVAELDLDPSANTATSCGPLLLLFDASELALAARESWTCRSNRVVVLIVSEAEADEEEDEVARRNCSATCVSRCTARSAMADSAPMWVSRGDDLNGPALPNLTRWKNTNRL
jgi:hypothetical protein